MAESAEETLVACRKFPGRAHHSKLRSHEQKHHEQNFSYSAATLRFSYHGYDFPQNLKIHQKMGLRLAPERRFLVR